MRKSELTTLFSLCWELFLQTVISFIPEGWPQPDMPTEERNLLPRNGKRLLPSFSAAINFAGLEARRDAILLFSKALILEDENNLIHFFGTLRANMSQESHGVNEQQNAM